MESLKVDYAVLLKKYIKHVGSIEGTDFINECTSDSMLADVVFTEEEIDALKELANEQD